MRWSCSGSGSCCCGGCSFSDHYTWPSMRELLLQFENLLRKRVDLRVLFVNLLCQSFKLRGLGRFSLVRHGTLRRSSPKCESTYCAENTDYSHLSEILPPGHLSDKRVRPEPLFLQVLMNPRYWCNDSARRAACVSNFCSYVFSCLSAFKSRWNRLRGDQNKAMAVVRVRRTFHDRTQRTC